MSYAVALLGGGTLLPDSPADSDPISYQNPEKVLRKHAAATCCYLGRYQLRRF